VKKPYLVQRGKINRSLGEHKDQKFSNAVSLEYMGSAEFEWGALPRALRALESIKDSLVVTTENSLTDDSGSSLRVMHGFNQQDYDEYIGYLKLMREDIGVIMLKEWSGFTKTKVTTYSTTDLWWDIENNVMWSFDKSFMSRLNGHQRYVCRINR